ncbi:gamma-glutamylcyclotransferase [Deinococcus hopiensis]|uniref:Uncharacterized conserved protein YtfP, gamma-glutamylcyclotransferase (GGCT)/AIG2-like family n=1 Tax=Deinococcus hopiensis KR-140 TaxID=695939 RepID=A0A1W1UJV7_9DEIO|nr:gamma-glutamylcyclotransferase [Deinococcus hopiensis]SMB81332.1 Uncharacterized conserved protein YtfP, gamma-glutamylcyclotransferase (GGCT)/AIG2-like family [Deinococcus hopiensis KR-140]
MSAFLDGQVLKERREEQKKTLDQVAQLAGVTRQYVSSVENNKVQLIPAGVQRITEAVGLGIRFSEPSESDSPLHFFTYGTMKPGFSRAGVVAATNPLGYQRALLAGFAMYDTNWGYPGLVRTRKATDLVDGFIYRYTPQTMGKALKVFDVIEGVDDTPPLFTRHQTVAITSDPRDDQADLAVPCWVYLIARSTAKMRLIKDGVWTKKGRD